MSIKRIGVYIIINKITGKFYIGSSVNVNRRWKEHRNLLRRGIHANSYLQNAWNKYGPNAFVFQLLYECSVEELINKEQEEMINREAFNRDKGYNLNPQAGSCLGIKRRPRTNEEKEATSQHHKKLWADPEYRAKMIAEKKLRAQTPEGRAIILKANEKGAAARAKNYEIIDPNGRVYIVHNLAKFCRENGLNRNSMQDVVKEVVPQCFGWKGKEVRD